MPAPQARAIVQAIEIEIAGARDTLATKQDGLLLRTELRQEMRDLRSELRTELADLRSNLGTQVADLRSYLDTKAADLRSDLRTEMHILANSNMRHFYLALLSQMAVLLGIVYFFVAHAPR